MNIVGVAAAVPKKVVTSDDYIDRFGEKTINTIRQNTGVFKWRKADANTFTSDLTYYAAEAIINDLSISRESIDAVLFLTQGPDSLVPTVSPILQRKLGLRDSILSLDITAGCSGYVDGLLLAEGLLKGLGLKRILLLVGDTSTKSVNPDDKGTAMLFGDAAAATLIDRSNKSVQYDFGTDGSGSDFIKHKKTFRDVHNKLSIPLKQSDSFVEIDGAEVFNFTIKRVPQMINTLVKKSGWNFEIIDAFVFHQANSFIIKHLIKKMEIDKTNALVPISLQNFGNTSSASIPLTMVTEMQEFLQAPQKMILAGFGVGLSWSGIALQTDGIEISSLVEV